MKAELPAGVLATVGRLLKNNIDLVSTLVEVQNVMDMTRDYQKGLSIGRRKSKQLMENWGCLIEAVSRGEYFGSALDSLFELPENWGAALTRSEQQGELSQLLLKLSRADTRLFEVPASDDVHDFMWSVFSSAVQEEIDHVRLSRRDGSLLVECLKGGELQTMPSLAAMGLEIGDMDSFWAGLVNRLKAMMGVAGLGPDAQSRACIEIRASFPRVIQIVPEAFPSVDSDSVRLKFVSHEVEADD